MAGDKRSVNWNYLLWRLDNQQMKGSGRKSNGRNLNRQQATQVIRIVTQMKTLG